MELKELIQVFKKHLLLIIGLSLVFGLLGAGFFYYYPKSYKAVGSFYVSQIANRETSLGDFTYEGYYAQQAGTNYAETFIGFLESVDVRSQALRSLGLEVNESSLRKSSRIINTKKAAPQLVTLTITALEPKMAKDFWNALASSAIEVSDSLNDFSGSVGISVLQVSENPIVHQTFNNLYVDAFTGLAFGFLIGWLVSALKEYLS